MLLERGLLAATDVVDGRLLVEERSTPRHRHVRVDAAGGGLFVKVADEPTALAAAEATVYELAYEGSLDLAGIAPACRATGAPPGVVVIGLLAGRSLGEEVAAAGGIVPLQLAAAIGQLLRRVHRAARDPLADLPLPVLHPWALTQDFDGGAAGTAAGVQLVREAARTSAVSAAVDYLRSTWTADAFVHGDVRSSNILVPPPGRHGPGPVPASGLWLLDWECAGVGDPAWDVGGALQDWIHLAVTSATAGPDLPTGAPRRAAAAIGALRPSFGAFWRAYHGGDDLIPAGRAAGMAGVRMLQTCLEMAGVASASPTAVALLLQTAVTILAAPEVAATEVFGL
jgi:hypothetical protein